MTAVLSVHSFGHPPTLPHHPSYASSHPLSLPSLVMNKIKPMVLKRLCAKALKNLRRQAPTVLLSDVL
jgi:hypothetical protein